MAMINTETPTPVTLIEGDGIGPEITAATVRVLEALGAPIAWGPQVAGMAGVTVAGDPLPQATVDSIRRNKLALKGPLMTPSGGGYRSPNARLREELQHSAALIRRADAH